MEYNSYSLVEIKKQKKIKINEYTSFAIGES